MNSQEILDLFPRPEPMKNLPLFAKDVRRAIIRAGHIPILATADEYGRCRVCGKTGSCPGWHTEEEQPES